MTARHHRALLIAFAAAALAAASPAFASYSLYRGYLGKEPVTMVFTDYNSVVRGAYFYDRHRTPIAFKPAFTSNNLSIDELDASGIPRARLQLGPVYFLRESAISGKWSDYRTGTVLPVGLHLTAYTTSDPRFKSSPGGFPMLQVASTERSYFILPLEMEDASVTTIEVYDKKTGKLTQSLKLQGPACNHGVDTLAVTTEQGRPQLQIASESGCSGARLSIAADGRLRQL
jgi:hypothetical protein